MQATNITRSIGYAARTDAAGFNRRKGDMAAQRQDDSTRAETRQASMLVAGGQGMPLPGSVMPRPHKAAGRPTPHQMAAPAPPVEDKALNDQLMGRVGVLVGRAHATLEKVQPFGHQLTPADISVILQTLKNTAAQVERLGTEASHHRGVSLNAMASVQATIQDLLNASSMYANMANGQAAMQAQNYVTQLRAAMAGAQANYSAVAGMTQREASAMNPGDQAWASWANSFAPLQMPSTSGAMGMMSPTGMTSPAGQMPMGMPSMPSQRFAAGPVPMPNLAMPSQGLSPSQFLMPFPGR